MGVCYCACQSVGVLECVYVCVSETQAQDPDSMLSAELSAAVLAVLPSPDHTIMGQAPWRDVDIHKPAVHDGHERPS